MEITSLQNAKVKYWVSLHDKKVRDKEKLFLIEGDHLINEAKKHNLIVETISINDKNANYYVTKEIMQKISSQESISNNAAVCRFIEQKEIEGNVLVLDRIQDPGNLGTIIRSACAFGFYNIILSNDSVDLYNDKVIRSTEGMLFNINIIRKDIIDAINDLKKNNYTIIGTDVIKGSNIKEIKASNKAIVIGNEGSGIRNEVKDLCDSFVKINMSDKVESLNAGVAASILMYEVFND